MVRSKKFFAFPDGTEVTVSSLEDCKFLVQFDRVLCGITSRAVCELPNLVCTECINFNLLDQEAMMHYLLLHSQELLAFSRGIT